MELKSIFIGIVILAMTAMGVFSFMNELVENYEPYGTTAIEDRYASIYQNLTLGNIGVKESTENMTTELESPPKEGWSVTQFFFKAPEYIWNAMQVVFDIPGFVMQITGTLTSEGILGESTEWLLDGFFVIVLATIGFGVLAALIKWKL